MKQSEFETLMMAHGGGGCKLSKKSRRPKNPLLQQKFDEGYALGVQHGVQKATAFFIKKFEDLPNQKGIGPRTMEILKKQLGEKYFN